MFQDFFFENCLLSSISSQSIDAICKNTFGSFECDCAEGFTVLCYENVMSEINGTAETQPNSSIHFRLDFFDMKHRMRSINCLKLGLSVKFYMYT